MDRITQNCVVSQEEEGKNVPAGTFSGVDFQELHESAYVAITQPQRVVVIPRYFINHWLPLLGPSRAWLVLAFRQTAFVVRAKEKEVVRPIPVRQLNRWSGLSHGQVWNLLAEPGFLSWFVRKVASSPSRRESDVWGVQVSVPVAPHHLRALENYVKETFDPATNRGDALLKYLRKIAKKLPSILWKTIPAQHKPTSEIRTVHQVFEVLVGPLDSAASKVCDEITGRITQPGNTIAISHYFIDRWRKDLTSGEAWLIHLLRCQVFNSNAPVPTAFIEGGKTRLADMLGVNKRSIRRWLAKLPNNKLASFVKLDNENGTQEGLELEICIRDPLHPDDETDYQRMLNEQHSGQNWTGVRTLLDTTEDKTGQIRRQKWTP